MRKKLAVVPPLRVLPGAPQACRSTCAGHLFRGRGPSSSLGTRPQPSSATSVAGRLADRCSRWQQSTRGMATQAGEDQKAMNVFNRNAKRLQRDRAAAADDARDYHYLHGEVAARLVDRLQVLTSHKNK